MNVEFKSKLKCGILDVLDPQNREFRWISDKNTVFIMPFSTHCELWGAQVSEYGGRPYKNFCRRFERKYWTERNINEFENLQNVTYGIIIT